MILKKVRVGGGDIVGDIVTTKKSSGISCSVCGGAGSHSHKTPSHDHTSSFDNMASAECVIGFYPDGSVRIIKDRYERNHDCVEHAQERIVEFLLNKISDVIFNHKLQMFQTTFNNDVKNAFTKILEEHKIKVKGINE